MLDILNFISLNINHPLAIFLCGIVVGFAGGFTLSKFKEPDEYQTKKVICGTLKNLTSEPNVVSIEIKNHKKVVFMTCNHAKGKRLICELTNTPCPITKYIKAQ